MEQTVVIDGATIRYRDIGTGPVVAFVHGAYVGGALWNDVVERLPQHRCIVPTWPLGAHPDPAPGADLSARATARRIPALLEALNLRDVTLVGNDTGGGLCLAALGTGHPGLERIDRLVLTNCDSYEHFPPKGFDKLIGLMRRVPPVGGLLLHALSTGPGRKFFLKSVCATTPTQARADEIFASFSAAATRPDALRFSQSLEASVTLDAAPAIRTFGKPVLLAWGDQDKLFPVEHARRLDADFPDSRLEIIPGASTYVMIDRPQELASLIGEFATGR